MDWAQVGMIVADETDQAAQRGAEHVQSRARLFAPKKTRLLERSIMIERKGVKGETTEWEVYTDLYYSGYQEWGTGVIKAKPKGVLVWNQGGHTIFAKRTSGVPAVHFMRKAADLGSILDFY